MELSKRRYWLEVACILLLGGLAMSIGIYDINMRAEGKQLDTESYWLLVACLFLLTGLMMAIGINDSNRRKKMKSRVD